MGRLKLPYGIEPCRFKTFGLTIELERLQPIRQGRMADSEYPSHKQYQKELHTVESLFRREAIPYLKTTSLSVEEILTVYW